MNETYSTKLNFNHKCDSEGKYDSSGNKDCSKNVECNNAPTTSDHVYSQTTGDASEE